MSDERPVREDFDSWGAHHDALVAWAAVDAVNGRRCLRCGTVGGTAGGCPLSLDGDHHYPDPAPSPSIPDPSGDPGEALPEQMRRIAADLDRINRPPSAAALRAAADELDAAATRPTSLPEAPEPDLWARLRSASERVDRASKAWDRLAEPPDVDAEAEWKTAIGVLRLRVHSLLTATPSAPPVAVDPEAGAGAS